MGLAQVYRTFSSLALRPAWVLSDPFHVYFHDLG